MTEENVEREKATIHERLRELERDRMDLETKVTLYERQESELKDALDQVSYLSIKKKST